MSKQALIFEVSASSFNKYVIENSHQVPVLVEFMGVWSEYCMSLEHTLAGLAAEYAEDFIFAKVDIDEQAELKETYAIENVPTLVVIRNGEVTLKQEGVITEDELRIILRGNGVVHESDLVREQAREKHMSGETSEAILLLTEAIKKEPGNTRVAMDMVQIFIDINELDSAQGLFSRLPEADQQTDTGRNLSWKLTFAQQSAKTDGLEALSTQLASSPDNYQVRFDLAICQINQYQYDTAMDNLFYIMQHQADFKDGAAKEMIITMINMLKQIDSDTANRYQQRLSNMLAV